VQWQSILTSNIISRWIASFFYSLQWQNIYFMTIKVQVNHITHYKYDRPVNLSPQTIRLRPSPHNKVPVTSYSFNITPKEHFLNWYQDIYGNFLANIFFPEKITEFKIDVQVQADINIINPFDFFLDIKYEKWPFEYESSVKTELKQYLDPAEKGKLLMEFVGKLNTKQNQNKNTIDFLVEVNQAVNKALGYVIRLDPGVFTCEETLTKKLGSCRDMAWLLCQVYRHLGFAARFVSGYSIQLKADEKPVIGPAGVEQDIVDLHAWTEIYIPGAGWVGLDPTSGMLCGEGHIPLCASATFENAAPVSGLIDPCQSTIDHRMEVIRIHEDPRTTKPFSDLEWNEIEKTAQQIDKDILKQDIRLTIGGEPTFISAENRDAPEWNTAALGKEKREKAVELLYRLRNKFSKGGNLHFGQGKWYGGETLPRWAFACIWRKDGEPIWNDTNNYAEEKTDYKYNYTHAKKFTENLTQALCIPKISIKEAYEDAPYYLLRERFLPIEGKLIKAAEKDDEVKKLLNIDKSMLGKPKGFVLPLIYSIKRKKWISNTWKFRNKFMMLIPGDSPIGYRLPLNSIPYIKESEREIPPERSNFGEFENLPKRKIIDKKIENNFKKKLTAKETEYLKKDKNGYVRTALCVEPRNGKLHIFLPPITYAEHYIELIAAIEFTAKKTGIKILIEGYEPPRDPRTNHFHITPDPGVIEVNVHPAKNWDDLKQINEVLFEEAKQTMLTAEKFMIDGRRVGTGGGNHITLGGITPTDSPWLRRPDLLKSVISYWQNHPGLSYLFSSIFIGPTSQAPRIDEARNDSLYELEIALQQFNRKNKIPTYLVDRLLRNILVDLTGNTHRAEISIDKLYTPEGERGRLGLVEFRGFEMTPHARMNLVQVLLIKALVTKFWKQPYSGNLIKWGTLLHDKYMLPHFVWEDFKTIISDLNNNGYNFDASWFQNQYDFRFPIYGKTHIAGAEIELKMALEPWPVLGEETIAGATSRGVDSALERVQVKVTGLDENRYALTCNKVLVPLRKTETNDCKIAGIRFKAWNPTYTMHPNLPIHTPLVFDVVDLQNEVSVGGFRYHVFHPGGRNYETTPVNVNEAEGRILSRFERTAHTSKKIKVRKIEPHPDFPYTLDLRRVYK